MFDTLTHPTTNQQNIRTLYYSFMCVYVVKRKKFCFCLFGYRSFFPGEQLRFIVRFSFCQNNIHIKDSIVVIKLIIIIHYYVLSNNATAWCDLKKDQKILKYCAADDAHQWYLFKLLLLLIIILRNIICNCKQTNQIVKFISNIT